MKKIRFATLVALAVGLSLTVTSVQAQDRAETPQDIPVARTLFATPPDTTVALTPFGTPPGTPVALTPFGTPPGTPVARTPVLIPGYGDKPVYYDLESGLWTDSATREISPVVRELEEALKALSSSDDDADRQAAKAKLQAALGNVFDHDMKRRESQLQAIRHRLAKMESEFTKRADKRDEIIELRTQVLVND